MVMEIPSHLHHLLLRWQSRGKRSSPSKPYSDDDEISAAAHALIMLANSHGGTKITNEPPSLPTSTTTFHPRLKIIFSGARAHNSATATATKNVQRSSKSPDTPLLVQGASDHHCRECGQIFKSHQALGGHMTKHRLNHKTTTTTAAAVRGSGVHECAADHKRKHYNNQRLNIAKKAKIKEDETMATSHVPRLDFDLNLPADDECGSAIL